MASAPRHTTPRAPSAPSAFSESPPLPPAERHASIRDPASGPPSMRPRAVPAESVFAVSPTRSILDPPPPPLPSKPLGRSANVSRSKPAPSVFAPSPPLKPASSTFVPSFPPASQSKAELFYQQPPARSRRPYNLHNKDCGVKYKSTAKVTKADMKLVNNLFRAEVFEILVLLSVIYHCRNNTIPGPNQLTQNEIRGIFDCDIIDYQFSLNELYKRYAMRKGVLYGRDVTNLNFWNLYDGEVIQFMSYLNELSYFEEAPEFKLWTFGKDDEGKWFLKLKANRIILNYFQLFNAIHDSLYQWRSTPHGEQWINSAAKAPSFYIG